MSLHQQTKKIIAVAVLAAFVLCVLFGTCGLAVSSHHDCSGAHCRTCERIVALKTAVDLLQYAVPAVLLCGVLYARLHGLYAAKPQPLYPHSAVHLKIKLNR